VGVLFACQLPLDAGPGRLVKRPQTGLDKPLAGPEDGGRPHIERRGNLGIAQPGISFEQHPGPGQFAGPRLSTAKHVF
jgi:hypothetical protein